MLMHCFVVRACTLEYQEVVGRSSFPLVRKQIMCDPSFLSKLTLFVNATSDGSILSEAETGGGVHFNELKHMYSCTGYESITLKEKKLKNTFENELCYWQRNFK